MTEAHLRKLFKLWQERLGLGWWQFDIKVAPCENENHAMEVSRNRYYPRATITVAPWTLTGIVPDNLDQDAASLEQVELSVVHELVHCSVNRMNKAHELYDDLLHRDVAAVISEAVYRAEEETVDQISNALIDTFGTYKPTRKKTKRHGKR